MADCMSFPKEPLDFIKGYSFVDSDEVYTNGSELVQMLRVEQMLEHYYKPKPKPKSQADKIRAMSDEELAEFFVTRSPCDFYCSYANKSCSGISCKQGILEWLKSEAKEET